MYELYDGFGRLRGEYKEESNTMAAGWQKARMTIQFLALDEWRWNPENWRWELRYNSAAQKPGKLIFYIAEIS